MGSSLTLKYIIKLASNISQQVKVDESAITQSQTRIQDQVKRTTTRFDDMGSAVHKTVDHVGRLERKLNELANNTSTQRQIGYMHQLARAVDNVAERYNRMREVINKGAVKLIDAAPAIGAAGYGAYQAAAVPLKAYATLEQATTDLRVAMTDARGKVSASFDKISKEAVELGNQLPGTTKDFMQAALELKANGASDSVIANGGLRASSYLGVLLRMDQGSAARMVAKTREAYGLKENELVPAADIMQRARFAYGVSPDSILASNTYMANELNAVGWGGLGRMREVLALQGIAAQRGMDGSVFGTNLKDFITRLAMMDTRLAKRSPDARHAREVLAHYGIHNLKMFGPDGKMVGPLEAVAQLQVFKQLKPQEQVQVFHQLFGEQGGQMAQMLTQVGPERVKQMLALQDNQGSLDMRLAMTTDTLQNKFEALSGTVENFNAQLGQHLGNNLKGPIDTLNNVIGGPMQDWLAGHPKSSTALLLGTTAGVGYGTYKGAGALRTWLLGRGATAAEAGSAAAAVEAGYNPFRGVGGGGVAAAPAEGSFAARALRTGSRFMPLILAGIESGAVLTDDTLTAQGKARGVTQALVSNAGGWAGAKAGAMLGARLAPKTWWGELGGIAVGGGLGYFGANKLFNSVWGASNDDYVHASAPRSEFIEGPAGAFGQHGGLQIGKGQLDVIVHVDDQRVTATTGPGVDLGLLRVNPGSTNPGGY